MRKVQIYVVMGIVATLISQSAYAELIKTIEATVSLKYSLFNLPPSLNVVSVSETANFPVVELPEGSRVVGESLTYSSYADVSIAAAPSLFDGGGVTGFVAYSNTPVISNRIADGTIPSQAFNVSQGTFQRPPPDPSFCYNMIFVQEPVSLALRESNPTTVGGPIVVTENFAFNGFPGSSLTVHKTDTLKLTTSIQENDFKDVAENAVTADADPSRGSISAKFRPGAPTGTPIDLHSAAALASKWSGKTIDHFNWLQIITHIEIPSLQSTLDDFHSRFPSFSDDFISQIYNVASAALAGRTLGFDPSLGGNFSNNIACGGDFSADNLPFYYDEVVPQCGQGVTGALGRYDFNNLLSAHTHAQELDIYDTPNLLFPGVRVHFDTMLVGVTNTGSGVVFSDIPGLGFKWTYLQTGIPLYDEV